MKRVILLATILLATYSTMQGQTLYAITDDETTVQSFDISGIDSIRFTKAYTRVFKDDATTKTFYYSTFNYMTFTKPDVVTLPDYVYVPYSYRNTNFLDENGTYYIGRSAESEHYILFWQAGFGSDPATCSTTSLRTNPTTVLNVAEKAWTMYVDSLGFVEPGSSKTDKYKMMMFLNYTSDWVANGSGVDDMIGTLNLSPWAASSGATVSHEVGHTFQYQTHCDLGSNKYGFMYVLGSGTGNGYWEQTAQWQAYQLYPSEAFTSSNFSTFTNAAYLSPFHEDNRYANYFINYYWSYKRGAKMVGQIWRQAKQPEDPAQAYMRLNGITLDEYNNETWDMAARWATWDIPAFKNFWKSYYGTIKTNLTHDETDGYWQVNSENCIQDHGFNIIKLETPTKDTVTACFEGIAGADGYRSIGLARAGWRSGFVALLTNGERVYGDMTKEKNDTVSFVVPANLQALWYVVSSAPKTYKVHSWDDNANNDEQWPYRVKFDGTDCYQTYTKSYQTSDDGLTTTVTFNINLPYHAKNYQAMTVQPDLDRVAAGLNIAQSALTGAIGSSITFYAVNANGSTTTQQTAQGDYGQWFNAAGNVCSWGTSAYIFSECTKSTLSFYVGQYPGRCTVGKKYTVRQKLVRKDGDTTYNVLFIFNVTMVKGN